MAALTTRAAAMTLAAGVTFLGSAALVPGLASAAPADSSNGNCMNTIYPAGSTSPNVICPSPTVRAGKTTVEVGKQLTFEVSNFLSQSKYAVSASNFTLTGKDAKGLVDKSGDDKRGIGNSEGIVIPLNINLKNSKTIDPVYGSVTLTISKITNDMGKAARNLKVTYKITKATDSKTIKTLRSDSANAKGDKAKLAFLLNIAHNSRSKGDVALIDAYEAKLGEGSTGAASTGTVLTSATSATQPSGSLAFTGAEIAGMSVVGLGLLGTGAFLVIGARRRKGAPVA